MAASSSSSSSSSSPTCLRIGIIGFGPFAQFLAGTMLKQGHVVVATSRSDHSELSSRMGVKFYRNIGDMFSESEDIDVVLLSMSILSMADVVRSAPLEPLGRRRRDLPLFVDVLSVKEYPRDLLLQVLPEEADVLCTHPMFGPESGKQGWKGLPLVYERVRIRNQDICQKYLQIFETEECRMVEMSCEEHDKMAAKSQFITHTIGRVLSEMDSKSTPLDTKGFQTLLQLRNNTTKDSFDLYRGLFQHNRFAKEEMEKFELALRTVREKLLDIPNGKEHRFFEMLGSLIISLFNFFSQLILLHKRRSVASQDNDGKEERHFRYKEQPCE